MKFKRIFGVKAKGYLQAVIYPGDNNVDIFRKLFNQWNDTQYLFGFFKQHQPELNTQYCNYISINDAIGQVQDEALDFEQELRTLETGQGKSSNRKLSEIFVQLHRGEYALLPENTEKRRAKPNSQYSLLRLYAIELDGCYVISGGAIKLQFQMNGPEFDAEISNLDKLKQYLKSEGIFNKDGFDD